MEYETGAVVCSLQYWSECHGAFQPLATFLLSETEGTQLTLTSDPGPAVSTAWRILVAGNPVEDSLDSEQDRCTFSAPKRTPNIGVICSSCFREQCRIAARSSGVYPNQFLLQRESLSMVSRLLQYRSSSSKLKTCILMSKRSDV